MQADQLNAVLDNMRRSARLAVIHGGDARDPNAVVYSTRNPRSTKRYEDVASDIAQSLARSGFKSVCLLPDDMHLPRRLAQEGIHLAWLNTGGTQGLTSACHAAAMLELCGIPYVGHNPLNAALLDNKHMFKHVVSGLGLSTAPHVVINVDEQATDIRQRRDFIKRFSGYDGDFVVKPVSGRASLHVHVTDRAGLLEAVRNVFDATGNPVLIESFLPGAEFTAGVSGPVISRNGQLHIAQAPFVFSVLERLLDSGERIFTSKDMRPIGLARLRLLDPNDAHSSADAPVLGSPARQIASIAAKLYRRLGLESAVRADFRCDAQGRICLLEANPKPDLKQPDQSVVSLMTAGLGLHGMHYDDLIVSLLADRLLCLLTQRSDYARALAPFADGVGGSHLHAPAPGGRGS